MGVVVLGGLVVLGVRVGRGGLVGLAANSPPFSFLEIDGDATQMATTPNTTIKASVVLANILLDCSTGKWTLISTTFCFYAN